MQIHAMHYPDLKQDKINEQLNSPLSEREFEVVQLIYKCVSNNQIAQQLFISINTIKKHINSAYLKIEATTRTNALVRLREMMQ
jgi:ATP/maltotriose-dependent transcriptional regulator MalT